MSKKKKSKAENTGNPFAWENRANPSCLKLSPIMIVMVVLLTINFTIGIILLFYGIFVLFNKESPLYHLRVLTTNLEKSFIVNLTFTNPILWGILSVIPFGVLMGVLRAKTTQSAIDLMKAEFGICLIIGILQLVFSLIPIVWLPKTTGPIVKSLLETSLSEEYIGLPQGSFQDKTLSLLWDDLMVLKLCCGVSGEYDFNPGFNFKASAWVNTEKTYISNGKTYTNAEIILPKSCCKLNSPVVRQTDAWYNIQNYLTDESCPITPTEINSNKNTGCNSTVYSELATYTTNTFAGLILMSLAILVCTVVAGAGIFRKIKMKKVEPVAAKRLNTYEAKEAATRPYDIRPTGPPTQEQPRTYEIPVVPLQSTASNDKKGLYYTSNGQIVRG